MLRMEFNVPTFKKIEAVGWTVAICMLILFYGNLPVFIGICVIVRKLYMKFKRSKLPAIDAKDKVVFVTGCDSGFGLALAKRLHDKGFTVFAGCLNPDGDGGKELKALNSEKLRVIPLDVTNDDSVSRCLKVVKEKCSNTGLWGLVNNAGLNFVGDVELTTMDQYLTIGNINMYGMVRTCKAFLPLLRQAKGRVVNVTSCKGLVATPSNAAYTMAKFGAEAFSETLRLEMSQFGVKVSIIEPCNFGGATGCMNEAGVKRTSNDFEVQWAEASADTKQFYGEAHLTQLLEINRNGSKFSATNLDPVLNAFEDALLNPCPHVRYLIAGSSSFFDFFYVLSLLRPYLPEHLFDKARAYFLPYIVYK
ncbi:unnamed protein product [Lymnaea stagnalis]|uniref:Uncharacterized protein n=1 Tax=Lymnaea stagnalis TaxID=6523 RepID=A0AAV2HZU4_LYMST